VTRFSFIAGLILVLLNPVYWIRAASIHVNDRYRLLRANEVFELTAKPFPTLAEQKSPCQEQCYAIFMSLSCKNIHPRMEQRCRSMLNMGLLLGLADNFLNLKICRRCLDKLRLKGRKLFFSSTKLINVIASLAKKQSFLLIG
jgi:hypothetical protein